MIKKKQTMHIITGFFIILATDSFVVFANTNQMIMRIFQLIMIIAVIGMFFKHTCSRVIIDRKVIGLVFTCVSLLMGMFILRDFTGGYFLKIILFIFGYYFYKSISIEAFVRCYIKCMKYITVFSLLVYIFQGLIVKIPFIPVIDNGRVNVYFVGLTNIYNGNQQGINRNWGPFWEPGVFQIYLIIALMLVLFFTKKPNKKEAVLFSVGIITTFSTAGYIALVILYMAYILSAHKEGQFFKLSIGVISVIGLVIIYFEPSLNHLLLAKFNRQSYAAVSFSSRWYSIWGNINICLKNPLFGVGPSNINEYLKQYLATKSIFMETSNTNTIFMNYSMFGAIVGTYYMLKVFSFVNIFDVKKITKALLCLVLLICLSTEPLVYSLLFHILIFYGYGKKFNKGDEMISIL